MHERPERRPLREVFQTRSQNQVLFQHEKGVDEGMNGSLNHPLLFFFLVGFFSVVSLLMRSTEDSWPGVSFGLAEDGRNEGDQSVEQSRCSGKKKGIRTLSTFELNRIPGFILTPLSFSFISTTA